MKQTRLESLIEANANTFIGFFVSLVFWSVAIVPIYHFKISMFQNIQITLLFTIISIIRGYTVRRFFNAGLHKFAHNLALKLIKRK